jgi:hypothetical protein
MVEMFYSSSLGSGLVTYVSSVSTVNERIGRTLYCKLMKFLPHGQMCYRFLSPFSRLVIPGVLWSGGLSTRSAGE